MAKSAATEKSKIEFEKLPKEDQKTLNNLIKLIGTNNQSEQAKENGTVSEQPILQGNEENYSKQFIKSVKRAITQTERIADNIEKTNTERSADGVEKPLPGNKKQVLSPEKLKEYYLSTYKKLKDTEKLIDKNFEKFPQDPESQKQLESLLKIIDLTKKDINENYLKNEQQIERELREIELIEKHKEQQEEKSLGGKVVKEVDKFVNALFKLLLPEELAEKFEQTGIDRENATKSKEQPKAIMPEKQIEPKAKSYEVNMNQLGGFSPSPLPHNVSIGKGQGLSI